MTTSSDDRRIALTHLMSTSFRTKYAEFLNDRITNVNSMLEILNQDNYVVLNEQSSIQELYHRLVRNFAVQILPGY